MGKSMDVNDYADCRSNCMGGLASSCKVPQIHNYMWLTEESRNDNIETRKSFSIYLKTASFSYSLI